MLFFILHFQHSIIGIEVCTSVNMFCLNSLLCNWHSVKCITVFIADSNSTFFYMILKNWGHVENGVRRDQNGNIGGSQLPSSLGHTKGIGTHRSNFLWEKKQRNKQTNKNKYLSDFYTLGDWSSSQKPPNKQKLRTRGFTGDFYQTFQEKEIPVLLKLFQTLKE